MKPQSKGPAEKAPELRSFELDSGTVHYLDEGEGTPIVFVHGTPSWPSLHHPLLQKLSKKHRCIAIDHFVSKQTGQEEDWTYNPKNHAAMVEQLIERLQLKSIALLLHDAGTPPGLAYTIQHPDNIANLILINTSSCSFTKSSQPMSASNRPTIHLGTLLYARLHAFRPTLAKKLVESGKSSASVTISQELADITAWYNEQWQRRSVLQRITTLLLWGECDKLTSLKSLQRWKKFFHECYVIHLENSTYSLEGDTMNEMAAYMSNFIVEEKKKREAVQLPS